MSKTGDTITFETPAYIRAYASCVGVKEGEGPLKDYFDIVGQDNYFGEKTWEKAETKMVQTAYQKALEKAGMQPEQLDCATGGDLLNQCISTSFANRELGAPFLGLYGACSTMAESLAIGAAFVSGGFYQNMLCTAASHFCSAERQYRYPLEYGCQRPQTSQWTATAAGAVILSTQQSPVRVTRATVGRIYDPGVTDANNMGAAMAQSAYETLTTYFKDTQTAPQDYDLVATGDLAGVGKSVLLELFRRDNVDFGKVYNDCGLMIYDSTQDVHAGGSGCGCSASVLTSFILREMEKGTLRKVLFCGTGALLSPTSTNQGESIPGICHLVCLEANV